jgi:PEGA domain-containing protein
MMYTAIVRTADVPSFARISWLKYLLLLCVLAMSSAKLCGENQVLGEVELVGKTGVERTSGVWVDGQYLGYLKELKGKKKILLLPGEHEIVVRQGGYKDFTQKVVLQPAEKQVVDVTMEKDPSLQTPLVTAEIKLSVEPDRAAVFVDGLFIGHVAEFNGVGKALLVAPGKRKITISLPGYQTFETEVDLVANQKFKIQTALLKAGSSQTPPPPNP